MSFEDKANMIESMLSEYQYKCLLDCYSGFGYNEDTLNTMLYVWFGMESDAFIDTYCKG